MMIARNRAHNNLKKKLSNTYPTENRAVNSCVPEEKEMHGPLVGPVALLLLQVPVITHK